jgi:hypothetical protein
MSDVPTSNYAIQCQDHDSGTVGSFTFDEKQADHDRYFVATSPVFPHLQALFDWAKTANIHLQCRFYNFPTSPSQSENTLTA